MSKLKNVYFCKSCGYESVKWLGKCPSCQEWNTFIEEPVIKSKKISANRNLATETSIPLKISEIENQSVSRIILASNELNRVLGGGLVRGSVVLIAGEPGIGKSTLFLQCALRQDHSKILYISGEESLTQIKMRAERLRQSNEEVYLYNNTDTQSIMKTCEEINPDILIIDSIQTLQSPFIDSSPGSISQIREASAELIQLAKRTGIPVFLIGHINKDGNIAGPKLLEHMVDVVLQFEGERQHAYRLIRTLKNRYGSTSELGIFEMLENGLREVNNPSELLLSQSEVECSGSAIGSIIEGNRPLQIEVQALVTQSMYGTPQRTSNGFDMRRLQLVLAVLEKRAQFAFGQKDVFLNMAGNLKVEDPAIDLAVCAALISSFRDVGISQKMCFCGELSLSGEIRPVSKLEQRAAEAEKLGITHMVLSSHAKLSAKFPKLKLIKIQTIQELDQVIHQY